MQDHIYPKSWLVIRSNSPTRICHKLWVFCITILNAYNARPIGQRLPSNRKRVIGTRYRLADGTAHNGGDGDKSANVNNKDIVSDLVLSISMVVQPWLRTLWYKYLYHELLGSVIYSNLFLIWFKPLMPGMIFRRYVVIFAKLAHQTKIILVVILQDLEITVATCIILISLNMEVCLKSECSTEQPPLGQPHDQTAPTLRSRGCSRRKSTSRALLLPYFMNVLLFLNVFININKSYWLRIFLGWDYHMRQATVIWITMLTSKTYKLETKVYQSKLPP